jgi:uncharacterized protein YjbI with pentapeptide repeats
LLEYFERRGFVEAVDSRQADSGQVDLHRADSLQADLHQADLHQADLHQGESLSIKFAVRVGMSLVLSGLFSTSFAQESAPPANPDSPAQTQSQPATPTTQSQTQSDGQEQTTPQAAPQAAPQGQTAPSENSSGQNPEVNSGQQSQDKSNFPAANPQGANQQNTNQQSANPQDANQQNSNPQNNNPQNSGQQNAPGQQPATGGKVAGTSNDRLFYALPNFLSIENQKLPPLTVKEKFKVVALGTFDRVNYPWWGLIAAIYQADNSEPGYGQGWGAYAKRYGATAGDSIVENFMVGAVMPSILHQDPRFYYSTNGGIFRRTLYAVSRIVVTRGDSGKKQFNFSEVFGAAIAAGITTNTYHPKGTFVRTRTNPHEYLASERTLGNTATVWGTQMGLDSITLVIKEFWPDIHRRMERKRMMKQSAGSPANSSSGSGSNPDPKSN